MVVLCILLCDVEGTRGLFFLVPKILAVAELSTLAFPVATRHAASFSSIDVMPLTAFQGDNIKPIGVAEVQNANNYLPLVLSNNFPTTNCEDTQSSFS